MANLPINEEQIMQLQANGKVSPVTADLMKKKQLLSLTCLHFLIL